MSDVTRPTYDEICRRIYAGRHSLRELGVDPGLKAVEIVVGVDVWTTLMLEAEKDARERNLWFDPALPQHWRLMGFPISRDSCLDLNDIRFRSEVAL